MSKAAPESPDTADDSILTRIFTLDQLRPNPDNPRTTRNPRYDYIKASIRARGLASVPVVTRDPRLPEGMWTFSDGGNTRYAILKELWEETGESRFYEIVCAEKSWPGRLHCLVGHLAENEGRGSLTFIEKALGVQEARKIYQEEAGKKVSLRELSVVLAEQGLPVHYSSISRMEDTLKYLFPWMPALLASGFGVQGIRQLLSLRQCAEKAWDSSCQNKGIDTEKPFAEVFGECCQKFDDPESWSLEMFIDELIGDLTEALPDDDMDYDRWLLELRDARKHRTDSEDLEQIAPLQPASAVVPIAGANDETTTDKTESGDELPATGMQLNTRSGTTAEKTNTEASESLHTVTEEITTFLLTENAFAENKPGVETNDSCLALVVTQPTPQATQPETFWQINAFQDDIEHLQSMAYRLCWDITEALGCAEDFEPAGEDEAAPGYRLVSEEDVHPVALLLSALAGSDAESLPMGLTVNLLIGTSESSSLLLNDEITLTLFRLVRILRRLRELQRQAAAQSPALPSEGLNNEY